MERKLKPLSTLASDEAAQRFVAEEDLSRYDLTGFKAMAFKFEPKVAALNTRLPLGLFNAAKAKA